MLKRTALIAFTLLVTTGAASSTEFGISGLNMGMTPDQIEQAALQISPEWKWSGFNKWSIASGEEYFANGRWKNADPMTRSMDTIDFVFSGIGSGNGLIALKREILFGDDMSKVPSGKTVAKSLFAKFGEPSLRDQQGESYHLVWRFDETGKITETQNWGNCQHMPDAAGLKIDPSCGLFVVASISSDSVGYAGRLNLLMIDHTRAAESQPLDEKYAEESVTAKKAKVLSNSVKAPAL